MGPIEAAYVSEAKARRDRLWHPKPKQEPVLPAPTAQVINLPLTFRSIMAAVIDGTDITFAELKKPSRLTANIVYLRMLAVCVARRHTELSFPQIAIQLSRDHTTIIAASQNADELLRSDTRFCMEVARIEKVLGLEWAA